MTEEVSKEQIKGENGTGIDEAKRLKEKKGANMVVKILAIVLVPLIAIAVNATTITTIVLTRCASTAACPTIRPPTTPIVPPSCPGSRIPASLNNSNDNSISSTSTITGNGPPSLAENNASKNGVGNIPQLPHKIQEALWK